MDLHLLPGRCKKDLEILTMGAKYLLLILFISAVAVSGCLKSDSQVENSISDICVQACREALSSGRNLESGPCLLDPVPQNPEWVCDVAHSPIQPIDNLVENQCSSYRIGASKHFIEVTPECQHIKAF